MNTSALRRRKERLRLAQTDIVRLTGLDKTTVNHTLNGSHDPRSSTLQRISDALTKEEIVMRDYLLALHPVGNHREELAVGNGASAPAAALHPQ